MTPAEVPGAAFQVADVPLVDLRRGHGHGLLEEEREELVREVVVRRTFS
jgi:hypothetical protein